MILLYGWLKNYLVGQNYILYSLCINMPFEFGEKYSGKAIYTNLSVYLFKWQKGPFTGQKSFPERVYSYIGGFG
jgi:hypothetical protein